MNHTLCGAVDPKIGRWRCTRPTGHGGDHIASIGPYLDGDDALAQWPRRAEVGVDKHTIVIASILSHRTKEGLVELTLNGEKTQMDLAKAREVRGMLDGAIEAAVSDELVFKFLTSTKIGLSEGAAAAALLDFRELRQGTRETSWPQ